MISSNQIDRLVRSGEFPQLLDRILANGRCPGQAVRRWLCRQTATRPLALGLAMQRLCELTYGPCPLASAIVLRLLAEQRADGSFGSSEAACPAATAAAAGGLLKFIDLQQQAGVEPSMKLVAAAGRALDTLAGRLSAAPDPLVASVVLWQLGDRPELRSRIATERLIEIVNASTRNTGADRGLRDLGRVALAIAA